MAEQWWGYIQRHLDERSWTPSDLSRAANINRSIIGRWREGAKPEVTTARALATALGRPVLEVLVASGLLTPDEAGVTVTTLTVGEISDEQLVTEIAQRLRERRDPAGWELAGEPEVLDATDDEDPPVYESDLRRRQPRRETGCGKAT